jgi:hypothetical protein
MRRLIAVVALGLMTAACGGDKTYTVDGVPVVLEQGIGPDRDHMAMTVELYRQAAIRYFGGDPAEEPAVWRALAEIRYTQAAVEGGAYLDSDGTVWSNWFSCTLDVPLYRAFAEHYGIAMGSDDLDADRLWAAATRAELRDAVCDAVDPERIWQWRW